MLDLLLRHLVISILLIDFDVINNTVSIWYLGYVSSNKISPKLSAARRKAKLGRPETERPYKGRCNGGVSGKGQEAPPQHLRGLGERLLRSRTLPFFSWNAS